MSVNWKYFLAVLTLIVIVVWSAALTYPGKKLYLVTCDVGQGDASLIIYGETQILIDGGPGISVLECLSKYIPFWDRKIELVILSHPQADHYKGLIEVLKRFDVDVFVNSGLTAGSQEYRVLESWVGGSGARVINVTSGMVIRSGMIYLDILHPSGEYILSNADKSTSDEDQRVLGEYTSSRDPNKFSIVLILRLGKFEALFTGDIDPAISDSIAEQIMTKGVKQVEYIKIPHHGSKNGVTEKLINTIEPEIAVISVGKDNRYGHPHKEVIKTLSDRGIKILRTDEQGDVEVASDGDKIWLVN